MTSDPLFELKYPVGPFRYPKECTQTDISSWIKIIRSFPAAIKETTHQLTDAQLQLIYRPEGWSIQQVIHHCADSHMNSFIRFKLALTEDQPTIKSYYENLWAQLSDVSNAPISDSILLLQGLHHRWAILLESLSSDDMGKTYTHPESGKSIRLDQTLALYAWHCNHHLAHIEQALRYNGTF